MRVEVDAGKARMGAKIAANRERNIPYLLIVGDRDAAAGNVSVRLRSDEDLGAMPIDDFVKLASDVIVSKSLELK
jgi:threonyl-tRNA synthetase